MLQTPAADSYSANFRGAVYNGDQIALLFMAEKAKECLRNITHIFFDGTFFPLPVQATQLFNIFGLIGNEETERTIPLPHVLITHRTEHLYKEVLNKVCELISEMVPSSAVGDFERASRHVFHQAFSTVNIDSCSFHFSQRLWRKIQIIKSL